MLEALVKAGAFDGLAKQNDVTRARLFARHRRWPCERAAEAQRERESGQTTLLALLGGAAAAAAPPR